MSNLSSDKESALATSIAQMANLHVALFSSSPGEDGTSGTEITTTIRPAGRLPVTFAMPAVNGEITSNVAVDFGLAPSALSISHWAIFDAQAGGKMVGRCTLPAPRAVQKDAPVRFKAGAIRIAFD